MSEVVYTEGYNVPIINGSQVTFLRETVSGRIETFDNFDVPIRSVCIIDYDGKNVYAMGYAENPEHGGEVAVFSDPIPSFTTQIYVNDSQFELTTWEEKKPIAKISYPAHLDNE